MQPSQINISGPIYYNIFNIFSLKYSKNAAIVSRSFILSTFGIQTLSHFIKSLCVIKNSKNTKINYMYFYID